MNGFCYYVPTRKPTLSIEDVRQAGLSHALNGAIHQQGKIQKGPDGGEGVAFNGFGRSGRVGPQSPDQQWEPVESEANVFICVDPDVDPEKLARSRQVPGRHVELEGNQWHIPVARSWSSDEGTIKWYNALPQRRKLQDGQWIREGVLQQFQELWDYAQLWYDTLLAHMPGDEIDDDEQLQKVISFEQENEACCCAIQTNYHVSTAEINLLGIVNDWTAGPILNTLIDLETFRSLQQKKTQGI